MRILVVVHGFPPRAQGGSEIYAFEHARTLARLGHQVFVLTREQETARDERTVRIEYQHGMQVAWVNNTFADTTDFADSYEHPRLADVVMPLIDTWAPDVAHVHHLTCLSTKIAFALADRRVPVVYTLHDYWLMCHRGQLLDRHYRLCSGPGDAGCGNCVEAPAMLSSAVKASGLAKLASRALPSSATGTLAAIAHKVNPASDRDAAAALESRRLTHMRDVCSRVTHFLAPSRCMRDAFVRFGIDAERITWSPYGFNRSAAPPPQVATSTRPLRIGFIGTLMVSKAPHVVLEAFQQLAEGTAELHVHGAYAPYHGDDSYRTRLAPLLAVTGVTQQGPRPHAEILSLLAQLDVLVVPSIWQENSPLVIQEALVAGVPVVASRTGGIPELIREGENGFLFEPGNASDLAAILARLANDRTILDRLNRSGSEIRTLDDDAQASVALYERLRASIRSLASGSPHQSAEVRPSRTNESRTPRVAAVLLHYRTPENSELALLSLRASSRVLDDIIGVNNDDVAAADPLPSLTTRWIHTGHNLGFSGGANVGIRAALARAATHVMLVNSDVTVPPDTVDRLLAALDSMPGAGIAGPVIASRTHPDVIASAGIRYDRTFGRMRHLQFGDTVQPATIAAPLAVDAVSGCVMLVKREVLEHVGYFEEDYFYGFEDIDFCLTARGHGYATVLASDAVVYHHGAQSIGPHSVRRLYFGARNHLLLAARVSGGDRMIVRLARGAAIVALNVAHAVSSPGDSLSSRLGAVARGIGDYVGGRFGPDH